MKSTYHRGSERRDGNKKIPTRKGFLGGDARREGIRSYPLYKHRKE